MKKKIPRFRFLSFVMVLVLLLGIATPCYAESNVDTSINHDGVDYDAGTLVYDYSKIPPYMLDNLYLRALQYIGYDVAFLKEQKELYNPAYFGTITLPSGTKIPAMSILEDETGHQILSYIPYNDEDGIHGSITRTALPGEMTATGNVPDVDKIKEKGFVCTTFIEYVYFNYIYNVEGSTTGYKDECRTMMQVFSAVMKESGDTWQNTMEGTSATRGLVERGLFSKTVISEDFMTALLAAGGIDGVENAELRAKYKNLLDRIKLGSIIRFGAESEPFKHYGIYIGCYNNQYYVMHMGSSRGPEISTIENIASYDTVSKRSYPIVFYEPLFTDDDAEKTGTIQILKVDAADGKPLAGAEFVAEFQNGKTYEIGPTNEAGIALREGLPLGKYTIYETKAPDGYELSSKIQYAVLSEPDDPADLTTNPLRASLLFTNDKAERSIKIVKNTNTGESLGGWQFQLYRNEPFYSAAVTIGESAIYRVKVLDGYGKSVYSNDTGFVYAPVANEIVTQPTSQIAALNSTASFKIAVSGTGNTYQWQYSDDGGVTWSNSSNSSAKSTTYKFTMLSRYDNRQIRCLVSTGDGQSLVSNVATAYLPTTFALISGPKDMTAAHGSQAVFSVDVSGEDLTFQWQHKAPASDTWSNAPSVDSSIVRTAIATFNGYQYRCVISDGTNTITTDAATLTVTTGSITSHPTNQTVNMGETATFTASANISGIKNPVYVWQVSTDNGRTWTDTETTGTTTLSIALTENNECALYRMKLSDFYYSSIAIYSKPARLLSPSSLYVDDMAQSIEYSNEGTIILSANASGTGLVYIWEKSTDGGNTWETVTKPIGTYTTGNDGTVQIYNLVSGDYFVAEINDGKENWTYDSIYKAISVTTAHTPENPAVVTFSNIYTSPITTGSITIHKETTNGGRKDGWMFYLMKNGSPYKMGQTNGDGILIFTDMEPGLYTVQEMGRMDTEQLKYWILAKSQNVTVVAGEDSTLTFVNEYVGMGTITKVMADGSSPIGTQFKLSNGVYTIGFYTVENENGVVNLGQLQPGIYYVEEILPDGSIYKPENGVLQRFTVVAGETANVTFVNVLAVGHVSVTKNAINGSAEGWLIHLIDAQGNKVSEGYTNENGVVIFENLQPGTYSVKEIGHKTMTEEQLSYWQMDLDAKPVTVVAGETASATITNTQLGKLIVNIAMEDGTSPEGWRFTAVDANGDPIPGSTFTVDASGTYPVGLLLPGTYTVTELIPDGSLYACKSENPQTVQITAGETTIVSFVNNLRPGTITVHKTNGDGEPLNGAKILLEWLDNDVWKPVVFSDTVIPGGCSAADLTDGWLISDEEGLLIFTGLHPGVQYRLTELEAPQGYVKLTESVVIGKLDIETLAHEHQIINEPGYPPPQTGTQETLSFLLLLSTPILAIFGVAMATNGTKLFNYGKNSRK